MPKLAAKDNTLLDGRIVLSRRSNSSAWQARYKIGTRWIRVSTKQLDKAVAGRVAEEMYLEAKFRHKNQMPIQTRRFKTVALLAIETMDAALKGGQGKKVYKDYIIALNRYLIPFFGAYNIDSLDYALIKKFEEWRIEQYGKRPKASSIGTHNSALNKVFDEAIERGFVSSNKRPELFNRGEASDRRPDFTLEEYRRVHANLRNWASKSRDGKTREMRLLLRDYVLILANSGIRHGTEAQNLRWKHIRIEQNTKSKRNMLLFYVNGKTGGREIVARHNCVSFLRRIHERTEAIKHMKFDELLRSNVDLPVFCLPDGTVTENLRGTFRKFLDAHGLLKDPRTDQQRTLYSLRHTYATFMLTHTRGTDIHLLAKQMGTSTLMIEKHYSHLIARMRSDDLAGYEHDNYVGLD